MADEITLEQDVDEVLGTLQAVEGDVLSSPLGLSDVEPEDEPEDDGDDGDEGSEGDDADA